MNPLLYPYRSPYLCQLEMTLFSFCSKRKSVILEEDLNYRNEMECSVSDRLRQFKESESKKKEDLQVQCLTLLLVHCYYSNLEC